MWLFLNVHARTCRSVILRPRGRSHRRIERGYTTTVEGIRMVRGPVPELQVEMVFGWG